MHGVPESVISDRCPQFTSHFWGRLLELLGASPALSTAFHPQTDGQTEGVNQTLEVYLRAFTTFRQDDWADLLPLAEFALNNAPLASSRTSPFFANYGLTPTRPAPWSGWTADTSEPCAPAPSWIT